MAKVVGKVAKVEATKAVVSVVEGEMDLEEEALEATAAADGWEGVYPGAEEKVVPLAPGLAAALEVADSEAAPKGASVGGVPEGVPQVAAEETPVETGDPERMEAGWKGVVDRVGAPLEEVDWEAGWTEPDGAAGSSEAGYPEGEASTGLEKAEGLTEGASKAVALRGSVAASGAATELDLVAVWWGRAAACWALAEPLGEGLASDSVENPALVASAAETEKRWVEDGVPQTRLPPVVSLRLPPPVPRKPHQCR